MAEPAHTAGAPVLRVQRLDPRAVLPARAHPGDAGLDLSSVEQAVLAPGARRRIRTGIAIELAPGWTGLVCPRSGLADRHGLTVVNGPGVVDAGYRGEVQVVLLNTDTQAPVEVTVGMRIAQLVVVRHVPCAVEEVAVVAAAERAGQGFGSSGTDPLVPAGGAGTAGDA